MLQTVDVGERPDTPAPEGVAFRWRMRGPRTSAARLRSLSRIGSRATPR